MIVPNPYPTTAYRTVLASLGRSTQGYAASSRSFGPVVIVEAAVFIGEGIRAILARTLPQPPPTPPGPP